MSNNETKRTNQAMPMLAMRGLVLFPDTVMHFDVGREKSILALRAAMDLDRKIFLVAQRDIKQEDPSIDDLYQVGVVATVKQLLKADKNTVRVLVEGEYKAKLVDLLSEKPFFLADIKKINNITRPKLEAQEQEAFVRLVKNIYEQYCEALPNVPKEMVLQVLAEDNPNKLLSQIMTNILISYEDKQMILEVNNVFKALELLVDFLQKEIEVLNLEHDIYNKVRVQMDKNQRDYFLREQLKVIQSELNDGDSPEDEVYELMAKVEQIKNIDDASREKLFKECERLSKMPMQSQEANVIRSYLEVCLDLPFDTFTKETIDVKKARAQLDKDHYGLDKVKDRILELLAVRQLNPDIKGQIICLVGPPGVGKTSIASSIAKTLNRRYARISLGGVRDESEIRGHRKTYLGSMPGRIIAALRQAKTNNPLILLDEIDKMGNDFRGDPASAMLEVLDSAQNNAFVDHYVEIPFDLSKVLFITTANTLDTIPGPLRDRMEIIELSSYTRQEKFNIAKKHLVKKQLQKHGLTSKMLTIKDEALYDIIDSYTREAGVRKLERCIGTVCRKAAKLIVSGEQTKVTATSKNIEDLIAPRRYKKSNANLENRVGVVSGLAWTSVGGEMLEIEVAVMSGSGKVKLTGSLGDVMKESAEIAISYVRTIANQYNIKPDFYKTCDIHIHAPEGAVPKDGPSAGVTMVTALVSALTGIPVRGDIAMTGEISLRGRVMPIGGLKEKSMAAYREQKSVVIIPKENKPDLYEVDEQVKEAITFVPAKEISDVLDVALIKNEDAVDKITQNMWCEFDVQQPTVII
ncbi:endopeptidase La [Paludicola sp. MB14-C6]|uniref:endopeptidase La n=1 Tax=Paludihabitans sp. MB14-C6 TaxID=3070656 RepID=UPI0027DBC1A9|nr:endopeptidase La [Paludicola sp. MB14-C6]WMJ23585.1 endopeptidase La [Paludicola sp. MB14-C6]